MVCMRRLFNGFLAEHMAQGKIKRTSVQSERHGCDEEAEDQQSQHLEQLMRPGCGRYPLTFNQNTDPLLAAKLVVDFPP